MASGHTGNVSATPVSPEEIAAFQRCAALGAAVLQDANLSRLVAAWPTLGKPIQRAMLAFDRLGWPCRRLVSHDTQRDAMPLGDRFAP
jgi:hypothetical protein